tara:strand:- start:535 stop:1017 length:483 start_codon:yes stop_codon:yes gene_type:complete
MSEISPIGWLHTISGTLALVLAARIIYKDKFISATNILGQSYLFLTAISAGTSLFIFNNGGFNLAHLLGVITLLAIGGGVFVEAFKQFPFAKYLQAISYSGTILCSSIPAISEVFTRLPASNPLATSIFDPILIVSFVVLFILYLVLVFNQIHCLKNQKF